MTDCKCVRTGDRDAVVLHVKIDPEVHRQAKSLVVLSEDRTLRNLVERLLREWVAAQRAAA